MWNPWAIPTEAIGCDIGAGHVRLAQVQGLAAGKPRLVVAERELPQSPDEDPVQSDVLAELIRDMLRNSPFRGTRMVSCLPMRSMFHKAMRLAPMPPEEVAQAAHWKAAAELSMKADILKSSALVWGTIKEGSKSKIEALVVGAPVADLDRHVDVLRSASVRPVAIDASMCAVARSLGATELWGADLPQQCVFLELRQDGATLAIVRGAELAFARPIEHGLSQLDQLFGDLVGLTPVEANKLYATTFALDPAGPDIEVAPGFPASRVRESIADASRMYGRELAREVALSIHYYSTMFNVALPEVGTVVSERRLDPAGLEPVAVQSGMDFTPFDAPDSTIIAQLKAEFPGAVPGAWLTAIGLSLYDREPQRSQEVA